MVSRACEMAFLAPCGAVFDDPVEKGAFEADIMSGPFAFDPFMAEDFLAFGKKFFVEDRVLDKIRIAFGRVYGVNTHG